MDIFWIIIVIFVVVWFFGGLVLPATGTLLNILIVFAILWLVWKVYQHEKRGDL